MKRIKDFLKIVGLGLLSTQMVVYVGGYISSKYDFHFTNEEFELVANTDVINNIVFDRERDSLALVALYNATDGPNWTNTWDLNQPINTWWGITLNNKCVIEIDLSIDFDIGNNLAGTIPKEVGDFEQLERLILSSNKLQGKIPLEIGNLKSLISLDLSSNELSDSIPKEISKLSELKHIVLRDNFLTEEIPNQIQFLNNLTSLDFGDNKLSGAIPIGITKLTQLESIWLRDNELSGTLPEDLGNLTNLRTLGLRNNQIGGELPNSIVKLLKLELLSLENNNLTGSIPTGIEEMNNLERLYLSNNELGGAIPSGLAKLTNIDRLQLDGNKFSGCIPFQLNSMCYLVNTNLNKGCGQVLGCQYDFRNNPGLPWGGDFKRFCDGEEQIGAPCTTASGQEGEINSDCDCVAKEQSCRERDSLALVALYNATDGPNWNTPWNLNLSLSTWEGITVNESGCVTEIDLESKNLTGMIPEEIGDLKDLLVLELPRNNLIGEIPKEIGLINNLEILWLGFNELSGEIPSQLGDLKNLTRLWISGTLVEGSIPEEIGQLDNLTSLALSDNKNLTGCIPNSFMNLCYLINTDVRNGVCNGEYFGCQYDFTKNPGLPWEGDFKRFCDGEEQISAPCTTLNGEEGEINSGCDCIIKEQSCRERDSLALVSLYNSTDGPNWTTTWDLKSPITTWHGIKSNSLGCVTHIELITEPKFIGSGGASLELNGSLNDDLGIMSDLEYINIHSNPKLSGPVPPSISELSNLRYLSLWENNLDGEIPSDIGKLKKLESLHLAYNNLTGNIPISIGELANLETLWLSSNSLHGEIPKTILNLSKLIDLFLDENSLSGEIPEGLDRNENLRRLILSANQFSGDLPLSIGNLSNLKFLWLSNNKLSGSIPLEYGNLAKLETLNFGVNELTGEIPSELGKLTELEDLHLNSNNLIGEIPSGLSSLSSLEGLFLNDNNLSSCFPSELNNICDLALFNVRNGCQENFEGCQYDFRNNPGLPWGGDFKRFCDGEDQIGAPCTTASGEVGEINSDCECNKIECDLDSGSCESPFDHGEINGCGNSVGEWRFSNGCTLPDSISSCYNDRLAKWIKFSTNAGSESVILQLTNFGESNLFFELFEASDCSALGTSISCIEVNATQEYVTLDVKPNTNYLVRHGVVENDAVLYLNIGENGCFDIPCVGEDQHPDYNALMELYRATNGDNWSNTLENDRVWDSSCDPCEGNWFGIFCREGRVTQVSLDNNNLDGSIPPGIAELTELSILTLPQNNLIGTIPSELGNLSKLSFIRLEQNSLTGTLPSSLADMPMLVNFTFADNDLSGCFPNSYSIFCELGPLEEQGYYVGYSFRNNPRLVWNGDFTRFCDGEEQIGAPCTTANGEVGEIDSDCKCIQTNTNTNSATSYTIECIDSDYRFTIEQSFENEFFIASQSTIVKFDSEGNLLAENNASGNYWMVDNGFYYSIPPSVLEEPISLLKYGSDLELMNSFILKSDGVVFDAEIFGSHLFILRNFNNRNQMDLEKYDLDGNLIANITLSTSGTNPRAFEFAPNSDLYFYDSSNRNNYGSVDFNLGNLSRNEFTNYVISALEVTPNNRIFITGRTTGDRNKFISEIDNSGNILKEVILEDNIDCGDCWIQDLIFSNGKLTISMAEPESNWNYTISCISLDLEVLNSEVFNQSGSFSAPTSNLISTINGGVAVVHSIQLDGLEKVGMSILNNECQKSEDFITVSCEEEICENTSVYIPNIILRDTTNSSLNEYFILVHNSCLVTGVGITINDDDRNVFQDSIPVGEDFTILWDGDDSESECEENKTYDYEIRFRTSKGESLTNEGKLLVYSCGDLSNSSELRWPSQHDLSNPGYFDPTLPGEILDSTLNPCTECEDDLEIPDIVQTTIFTPNGDGNNDLLQFNNQEIIEDSELSVFNRWGDRIYHKENYTNDWGAQGSPDGVYFYVLKVGEQVIKKTLTVAR